MEPFEKTLTNIHLTILKNIPKMFTTIKLLRQLLLIVMLISCQSIDLLSQDEKQISPKKLIKDFDELIGFIEAHPDPYHAVPEATFNAKVAEIRASLDQPHTLPEFYCKLAAVVALLKDGHCNVYFPRFWMQSQRKEKGAFPYEVHLTNEDELYVIKNYNDGPIPVGSKIIRINGISVDSFLNKIDPYISYELKRFRNTVIDEDFEKYLYLAFGLSAPTVLDYYTSDTLSAEISYMPYKDWKKYERDHKDEREVKIERSEPYAYKKIKKGIGLINIYAFSTSDYDSYKVFLINTFKAIKKDSIHSLIIDIRGNFGGWPKIASRLFHYISDSYFKTMGRSSMKVSYAYKNYMYDLFPSLRASIPTIPQRRHFIDIEKIMGSDIGDYVNEDQFFNEKPETLEHEFKGDCYLLINRDSYSAASSFASTFQCYQMGTIIGEETGGTKIFRANPVFQQLNKTKLRVIMSTTKLYTACYDQEFAGIKPTIEFTPSILDISSDVDSQLFYTLRVIKKIQKKKKAMDN